MENDPDNPIPPRVALYHGVVVSRADPLKIGRVRVRVPGLVEESDWALPLGGARGRRRGFFSVPDLGAEVGVWWLSGDPDRPFYIPGHWIAPGGAGQAPSAVDAATPEEAPDIDVIETDAHVILLDGRAGREAFEVYDKATSDGVFYERATMSLELRGTVSVKVVTQGAVDIQGLTCTILGRPVVPGAGPIR